MQVSNESETTFPVYFLNIYAIPRLELDEKWFKFPAQRQVNRQIRATSSLLVSDQSPVSRQIKHQPFSLAPGCYLISSGLVIKDEPVSPIEALSQEGFRIDKMESNTDALSEDHHKYCCAQHNWLGSQGNNISEPHKEIKYPAAVGSNLLLCTAKNSDCLPYLM